MGLPSSYKKLQYIQSSGTQYINTGFIPNQDTRIDMVCVPNSVAEASNGTGFIPYGAGESYTTNAFECYTSNSKYEFNYNGQNCFLGSPVIGQKLNIIHNKNEISLSINGGSPITNTFTYGSFSAPRTMTLFAINRSSPFCGLLSLYSCQIYDNGTLIRDFIPCRSADGTVGLWDDVNSVFYTNSGTGVFIGGPLTSVSLPSGYRRLEYIQSNGTQYIDTGFTVNKNDNYRMVLDANLVNNENFAGCNGYMQFKGSIGNGVRSIIDISYKNITETILVDGVLRLTQDWSSYGGVNVKLGIFRLGDTNNSWYNGTGQSGKLYACQIYKSGGLVRDLIPCKNTAGEVGLWDDVNSVFYGNAGTGTFIAGPFTNIRTGDILNYDYTGAVQSVTLPKGVYKFEVWGAEGGGSRLSGNSNSGLGGKGGYSVGTITLTEKTNVYVYVGGAGGSSNNGNAAGGFNGGGQGYASSSSEPGNGGGGASDIRIGADSLYSRVIVAGGGGGGGEDSGDAYGHGGGTSGVNGSGSVSNGTQTAAGTNGGFGVGAGTNKGDGGGGGGGWYGGGTGQSSSTGGDTQGGGGGSGYVLTASSSKPSGYALGSQYYLTNANTIAGNASMPSVSGGTETGHTGNGYARITVISIDSFNGYIKTSSGWKEISDLFVKVSINGTSIWKNADSIKIRDTSTWKNS